MIVGKPLIGHRENRNISLKQFIEVRFVRLKTSTLERTQTGAHNFVNEQEVGGDNGTTKQ